jgi:hypothetical protein
MIPLVISASCDTVGEFPRCRMNSASARGSLLKQAVVPERQCASAYFLLSAWGFNPRAPV